MKILYVHSGSDLYGASRSLLRLSSRLVKDGNQVLTVLPSAGPLAAELEANRVGVVIEPSLVTITRDQYSKWFEFPRLAFQFIRSIIRIYRLIRQFDPDLVHTMTAVIPSPGVAAKLAAKPHIWHIRETFVDFPQIWKYYQGYVYWLANRVVCVSTPIAEQFKPQFMDKVIVLHNGFPKDEFAPVDKERIDTFRARYGLTGGKVAVGVVGRIKFRRKGQEVFVEAVNILKDRIRNASFLCIGSPFPGNEDHLERLLQLIKKLGLEDTVLYTGDVEDIKAAISALDILVLPSVQPEPFGGVVIEAMAFHKPVIATAIGGSIEQVENNQTGILVEPGNPHQLAMALETLICNEKLRKEFGENGFERYLLNFEFEAFYARLLSLYHVHSGIQR